MVDSRNSQRLTAGVTSGLKHVLGFHKSEPKLFASCFRDTYVQDFRGKDTKDARCLGSCAQDVLRYAVSHSSAYDCWCLSVAAREKNTGICLISWTEILSIWDNHNILWLNHVAAHMSLKVNCTHHYQLMVYICVDCTCNKWNQSLEVVDHSLWILPLISHSWLFLPNSTWVNLLHYWH